jgi:flavin-dependent dehydrogenase
VDHAVDVIVVGGGPAGAAAGVALAARGVAVAVVTTSRPNPVRIGETVPPTIAQPLTRLGVYDDFLSDQHIPAPGTIVCWGDDEAYETDSISNPYGHGWHLDRVRFDTMLLRGAARAGARMHELDRFAPAEHGARGWSVTLGDRAVLRAPMLLDATGRSARIAMRHGASRRREDRLIGLVSFGAACADDHRTVIEACEHGWWYATVLPRGRAVTALMTDADLLPTGKAGRERLWKTALSETILVRDVMAPAAGPLHLHAAPASAGVLSTSAGADWVAVGDAARTLDPLSGQGVMEACRSATQAAEALVNRGRTSALRTLSADNAVAHRRHVLTGLRYYRRENRWSRSPFWARRHQRFQAMS